MKSLRSTLFLGLASVLLFIVFRILITQKIIDSYNLYILCLAGIYIIIALSLNLISGFTGQLSLGHAGFMAAGAYGSGILLIAGVPLPLAILGGASISALIGFALGAPALRLRGDYLAIVTLGIGEIIRVLVINLRGLTGGSAGLKNIPTFNASVMFNYQAAFDWIFPAVILSVALVANLVRSSHGRSLIAIRDNEIASQAMGVNIFGMKLTAFTISAFLAGLGGALYAPFMGYLSVVGFDFLKSVFFVVIVVLGGMGSITGTVISGIGLTFLQEILRANAKDWGKGIGSALQSLFGVTPDAGAAPLFDVMPLSQVVFGLVLVLLMIFRPDGLMASKELKITRIISLEWLFERLDGKKGGAK